VSNRGASQPRLLRGVELAGARFDAVGSLVPGNDDADMVRANPLHAEVISCCVFPLAKARTCLRSVDAVRPPAGGFVAAVGGWSLGRAGAAAFAAAGALGDVISTTVLSSSALAQARSPPVRAGALLALRIDIRQRLADRLLPSSTA